MIKPFSTEVRTTRIVQIDADGVLSHGAPDPTTLQIAVVDDQGRIHRLIFEGQALGQLAGTVHCLMEAIPDAFKA